MGCVGTKSNTSSVRYKPTQLQEENGALGEQTEADDSMKKYRQLPLRYENLILEGGGTKTYAYLGALKILEEMNVLQNIKRFGGASGGAVICALLAAGCDVEGLYSFFDRPFDRLSEDAGCGFMSAVPNLFRNYGWHPGHRLWKYFYRQMETMCGDGKITFKQLYEKKGTELCVCVTNISQMCIEYFHPKTTPDIPVVDALRMSTAIPGYFQPVRYEGSGRNGFYVDGGVLCNYPIFAYDGWYLSMDPKDSFLSNLGTKRNLFDGYNEKTLGLLVYSACECEMLRSDLHKRYQRFKTARPSSKLSRQRQRTISHQLHQLEKRELLVEAAQDLAKALADSDKNEDNCITSDEFKEAMKKIGKEETYLLFGEQFDADEQFKILDRDNNGTVQFPELVHFLDEKGVAFREIIQGTVPHQNIHSLKQFFNALFETMRVTVKSLHIKPADLHRTVGIHTDYITTHDFNLENSDRQFLITQGQHALLAFLEETLERHEANSATQ